VNVEPPSMRLVVDAVVNDAYVVDEKLNLFSPEKKLVSERSVDDAVLSVPVIVTGAEPSTVNPVHDTEPEHVADVVAVVLSSPVDPTYVSPCDRDVSLSADPNVELAVEKKPPRRPSVVDVELYPATDVKLNVEKFASFVSCEVRIDDVANEYVEPLAPTPRKPVESAVRLSVPTLAVVAEAYVNDPSVVDELENVLRATNVLAVYVLGIVVEELMNELVVLFRNVVSRVRALDVLTRPEPRRLLND